MLTQKEKKLLKLKLSGKTDQIIAEEEGYTYGTVRNYFSKIYEKVGVNSFMGVLKKIYEEGEKNFFGQN